MDLGQQIKFTTPLVITNIQLIPAGIHKRLHKKKKEK